jgi:hypothetical protein
MGLIDAVTRGIPIKTDLMEYNLNTYGSIFPPNEKGNENKNEGKMVKINAV